MPDPAGGDAAATAIPPQERADCQEVRLAVVMYGGVSLAIYMNGVAQEILRLVRATAIDPDTDPWNRAPLQREVPGTEAIYRRLGQILRRGKAPGSDPKDPAAPIYANFVVDVLSGTSAGGINAVFLAKALAVDGSLDSLRELWMREADIGRLVNDAGSLQDAPSLEEPSPPKSLLNSRRMYLRLVEALDAMDPPGGPVKPPSPYVDQLDLFVTATDLHGTALPIRLADGVVWERRHRNVFRFRYGWEGIADRQAGRPRNDFDAGGDGGERNRFLAFASRCTSAFPFAFEPMTFDQAGPGSNDAWTRFLREQLSPQAPAERAAKAAPEKRAFGDGGYLDNRPFSYAIDALYDRFDEGVIPVDRKLLYIEPAPDFPEDDPIPEAPPDALRNVGLALVSLPRHEAIREDLQRLHDRNRLARRVNRILGQTDFDVWHTGYGEIPDREGFAAKDLAAMVREKGVAYGSYQRLKVYLLTDEIAAAFAAVGGFGADSEEYEAIRSLVLAWREARYVEHRTGAQKGMYTHNRFLVDYDLPFRIRRLRFVRGKADCLLRMDSVAWSTLWAAAVDWKPAQPEERMEFGEEVLELKNRTLPALRELVEARHRLKADGEENPLYEAVIGARIDEGILGEILAADTDDERKARVSAVYRKRSEEIEGVMMRFHVFVRGAADKASAICNAELSSEMPSAEGTSQGQPASSPGEAARRTLWYHYQRYEDYDQSLLPILNASGLGEERDRVDVIRVSPHDARSLLDERNDVARRRKLAGTALFNFGAFLDRGWRRNDFLWGRLDGAERLIASALPGEANRERRQEMIADAHRIIIQEEIAGEDQAEVCRTVVRAVLAAETVVPSELAVRRLLEVSENAVTHPSLARVLQSALEDKQLMDFFRDRYEVDRHLDRAASLKVASRASRVIGRMFEDLGDSHSSGTGRTRWISRLAQVFWGIVEVAVPGSIPNLVLRHLLKVLYAFELTIILFAMILQFSTVLRFGLFSFGLTFGLHILTMVLEDAMRRRSAFGRWVAIVVGAMVMLLAVYGGFALFAPDQLREVSGWRKGALPAAVVGLLFAGMVARPWMVRVAPRWRRALRKVRSCRPRFRR